MSASHESSAWMAEYPITDLYELSSGKTCEVPFRCKEAQPIYLYGSVDIDALRSVLADQNYQPVQLGEKLGIAALTAVDYRDTSCGAYHEIFWSFLVSKKTLSFPDDGTPMSMMAAAMNADVVPLCHKLFLDQQFPIDAGREVFGFPKYPTPQEVEAGVNGQHFDFKLTCDGQLALRGHVALPTQILPKTRNTMFTVTSKEVFQTRVSFELQTAMGMRPLDAKDEMVISPQAKFGQHLIDLNFQPKLVVYMPNASFVMHKPLNWQKPTR